jgi:hypothetical protein
VDRRCGRVPAGSGDPHRSGLDRKLRAHDARKPDDGIDAIPKAYLRSLIDVIEVGDAQIRIKGRRTRSNGRFWPANLQVKCRRCETEASIPLDCVRRPRDTPIWKLEAALKCRSCRTPRYSPPVHMIRLTEERQTVPYVWVHPDEDR